MLAACRATSLFAVCQDLAGAPCHEAVRIALRGALPKRLATLERRLDATLCHHLPRWLRRHAVDVAIDLHLIPYHGQPYRDDSELYHSKPKAGTSTFHAYATACVVHRGVRFNLALTVVANREPMTAVLERLLDRVAQRGVRIRLLLADRQFSTKAVIGLLQRRQVRFLMPLARHGRTPKPPTAGSSPPPDRRTQPRTPREFLAQPVGCYEFDWGTAGAALRFTVVVASKRYRERRSRKPRVRKLIYAAWRVRGTPKELRERYRKRFGIESSYRQLGQSRARTSSRDPRLRLLFVAVSLVLRNVWVWLRWLYFIRPRGSVLAMDGRGRRFTYGRLRGWIETEIRRELDDGSDYAMQL
jgi:putative transposase